MKITLPLLVDRLRGTTRTSAGLRRSPLLPPLELLDEEPSEAPSEDMEAAPDRLREVLTEFGIRGEITGSRAGPRLVRHDFRPASGVRLGNLASLEPDIALRLGVAGVRISVPQCGQDIGIEVPRNGMTVVSLRSLIGSPGFRSAESPLPMALGVDVVGRSMVADLAAMPHLLVAGTTGAGKSVCLNAIVASLLYRHSPDALRLIIIDPKRLDLAPWDGIPHLLSPVATEPDEALHLLRWAVREMEARYDLLSRTGVRDTGRYNAVAEEKRIEQLPRIVIVVDELADILDDGEAENVLLRLARKSRAAGIHMVLATQRPSVDVLTGSLKANIPARLCLHTSSAVDSRTVLDAAGGETLLGKGDFLLRETGGLLVRGHAPLVTEEEVDRVAEFLRKHGRARFLDARSLHGCDVP